jgi:hypothetical protein
MAKTLEQVLGYVALTGTIKATTTGLPFPMPEGFMTTKKQVVGDMGRYTQITGTRRTARLAMYGSPAVKRELKDVAYKDVKLLHSFEEQTLPPLLMQMLRNYDNYDLQKLGIDEVGRQVGEFKQLFQNLRVASILLALGTGKLYFDGSGNLLPSSSGNVVSVDFGMSANNQNQLNGILSTTWKSAIADIPLQLRKLRQQARQLTGYPLKYAFYGENVPSYLTNNDYVQDYLARNPTMQAKFLESADLPAGLFGFDWIPVYESFFEDSTGTNQTIFNADNVIFTPEVSADWYEMMEGSYMVPTTLNIVTDAAAAMASMTQVFGQFGYGAVTHNPPTVNTYYGDTFLPVIKVPNAVFQGVVAF